jgi:hypothetical protein
LSLFFCMLACWLTDYLSAELGIGRFGRETLGR